MIALDKDFSPFFLPGDAASKQAITLITSDLVFHETPLSVVAQMGRLRGIFRDFPALAAAARFVAVPGVRGVVLARIIAWCSVYESFKNRPADSSREDYQDLEILAVADDHTFFETLAVAKYLEVEPLLEFGREALADRVHDKTQKELMEMYGIEQA